MDLNLRIIQAKDFLKASPIGEYDLEKVKQVLLKLARENAAPRQYDIMLDVRGASDSLTLFDITEMVQVMIENRDSFRSKLAILTLLGHQFDTARFMELYAGNRGFQVGAFVNYEEALNWLGASFKTLDAELSEAKV